MEDDCPLRDLGAQPKLQELLPSLDLPNAMQRQMEIRLEESRHNSSGYGDIGITVFILAVMPCVRLVDLSFHGAAALIRMMSGHPDIGERLIGDVNDKYAATDQDERKDLTTKAKNQESSSVSFGNLDLPDLEELQLRAGDPKYKTTPFHFIEAALLHPNLKALRLHGISWLQKSLDLSWPREPCRVQVLDLRESLIDASSLGHILQRFTDLRTLPIHLGDSGRYDNETE
jgi:hypothetical protein